jgi:selenocysteine-specific elongation factor
MIKRNTGASRRKERKEKAPARPVASEKDRLAALCRERGVKGVYEGDLADLGITGEETLARLSEELESEGRVKILSFSPLSLISQESFDYLCDKIAAFLEDFHKGHPSLKGAPVEKVKERFGVSQLVLRLAVKTLEKAGKVRLEKGRLMLASHAETLSPQEEKILQKLEDIAFRGELRSVSLNEIRKEFRLSEERLDRLMSVLGERKKIIQGPEGLFIHAHWLDEVIAKVRALGKKEMTVGEFKELTGLSRKYAIPLLELLDEMGVTRRQGASREILP